MLNIWSLSTMILAAVVTFIYFSNYIPPFVCTYDLRILFAICIFIIRIILTFYQIARLQYCFMDKQIHSKKYGYSKWIFYILYSFGIVCTVYSIIIGGFIYYYLPTTTTACDDKTSYLFVVWLVTIIPLYYILDWTVLLLYIIKVIQIKNKKKLTLQQQQQSSEANIKNNNIIIINRINITLYKILLLTILYEIISGITGLTMYTASVGIIFISFDPLITAFMMYLMVEHNNDEYLKLINVIYKLKICCCFNCLLNDQIDDNDGTKDVQNNGDHKLKRNKTVEETNVNSIEILPHNYIDESEQTMTVRKM